ncbi:Outer membrane efflux protein [Poriferisphaera corsica]|uniref:Outer membrane efflux protein n=1 Tax=Poriferisphaera corsica TaxID=2528020 RepID=A0A517YYM5_9BACT|nr:TolC family protein [Poriferisphaera corsica]QDU35330.1 Outer membrane efflux protein [Poriferisphaera corsica]
MVRHILIKYDNNLNHSLRLNAFLFFCAITTLLAALSGCQVDARPQWEETKKLSKNRVPSDDLIWHRTDEDKLIIEQKVQKYLNEGLTQKDAVAIALLNNKALQAEFENLGIAASDLLQSKLFTNPPLSGFLAFPTNLGNTTASLLFILSDFYQVPKRAAFFESISAATSQRVALLIIQTAAAAELAYNQVLYYKKTLELQHGMLNQKILIANRMRVRYAHGLIDELTLRAAEAAVTQQQIIIRNTEVSEIRAQNMLNVLLSLDDITQKTPLISELKWDGREFQDLQTYVEFALNNRLDVIAAKQDITSAKLNIEYQKTLIFPYVGGGLGWEGEITQGNTFGPVGSMVVPIFDQNQAQIAKAGFVLRQHEKILENLKHTSRATISNIINRQERNQHNLKQVNERLAEIVSREVNFASEWQRKSQINQIEWLMTRLNHLDFEQQLLDMIWLLRMDDVRLHVASWGGPPVPMVTATQSPIGPVTARGPTSAAGDSSTGF